jgi:hypothetical protein
MTYTFTPYLFSPFSTFIASTASGIGLPPRTKTPSISKAKAKESVVGMSTGVMGEPGVSRELDVRESIASSSRSIAASSFLAVSSEAAKPLWCDWDLWAIILSGTITTGPPSLISLSVAVMDERRRRPGLLPVGGVRIFDGAIVVYYVHCRCLGHQRGGSGDGGVFR